ncbi:translation factor GTPase family protein [Oribacterium sp. WCC10]|uniref:translation factor GTPase family protein n=1 Tax=Oribacterium sp. WCC10 TaxID=1855343 RepID=UPI0008EC7585|nr:TetM/TetW/TetO/TetS family tetracycline resistance ribosomal protection protein [Oribacterium sp. WCC10]SFG35042.1 small GTP-binding protein domain-containing protein [Oribacterium sp. WCC10]
MEEKLNKRLVIGILAHVDAGKTTLSECILYESGKIRSLGRVDNGSAYLDTNHMEKERGITIFSKMATFILKDVSISMLDTPGHVDFSAEMEKTLSVLDYAILVVNGADGVQGHTETLWRLLARYGVPAFIFVNKMDQPGTDKERLLRELEKHFGNAVVDFTEAGVYSMSDSLKENIAMCDERVMDRYLERGVLDPKDVRDMIWDRKLFPVYFGSALKNFGIKEFLDGIYTFTEIPLYPDAFGAKVFKISKDDADRRLTYMKITGGELKVRTELVPGEKISEIRIYSGAKYVNTDVAEAGTVCAVLGISGLKTGDSVGCEPKGKDPSLKPVLDYNVISKDMDQLELYRKLEPLSDEYPELHINWDSKLKEIHVHLMGEVQTEILKKLVKERFDVDIEFGESKILYLETIDEAVSGVGHFEPLRHYAEVHLLMEPLPRGSGLQFRADCPTDELQINWQRLVLTHLREKEHVGVLTGSPITDIRFTLVAGRAHLKHTEGGDFREATYRAVRQGLRKAINVLLEPYYAFTLEIPQEYVGRAMTDLSNMNANFDPPEIKDEVSVIKGTAAVTAMRDYHKEVMVYTRGRGHLFLRFNGYDRCHDAEEVIVNSGYDPDEDILNPSSSVFCAHGSGFIVPFDQVESYMHVESPLDFDGDVEKRDFEADVARLERSAGSGKNDSKYKNSGHYIADQELEDIFIRTFGPIKNRAKEVNLASARTIRAKEKEVNKAENRRRVKTLERKQEYLLVDGYNIIFAWDDLNDLASSNIDAARGRLLDIMSNYAGYTGKTVIVVFDAYRVQGHQVEQLKYHNIYVVYTKEAMTADEYIEEETHELKKQYSVTVATSDKVVQVITWGAGAVILSATNLKEEVERVVNAVRKEHLDTLAMSGSIGTRLELPKDVN